jgi:hypothetical protein
MSIAIARRAKSLADINRSSSGRKSMRDLTVAEQEQVGGGTWRLGKLIARKIKAYKAANAKQHEPKGHDPKGDDDC